MLDEHGEKWVRIFAGWMQEVMDSLERGQENAFLYSFIPKPDGVSTLTLRWNCQGFISFFL